jgi:hypothetical protein
MLNNDRYVPTRNVCMGIVNRCGTYQSLFENKIYDGSEIMTSRERALHKRLGRLKGELFKCIAYIESIQLLLVSEVRE